jgi:dnd system-associated protein 4
MKRINRDVCHQEMIKKLTGSESPAFQQIWQLLLFAASLGIRDKSKRPIENYDTGKAIQENYFSAPGWKGFLYLMRLVETENTKCLSSSEEEQDKLIKSFEEYSNYGLHFLSRMMETSNDYLDMLVEMCLKEDEESPEPDLELI